MKLYTESGEEVNLDLELIENVLEGFFNKKKKKDNKDNKREQDIIKTLSIMYAWRDNWKMDVKITPEAEVGGPNMSYELGKINYFVFFLSGKDMMKFKNNVCSFQAFQVIGNRIDKTVNITPINYNNKPSIKIEAK